MLLFDVYFSETFSLSPHFTHRHFVKMTNLRPSLQPTDNIWNNDNKSPVALIPSETGTPDAAAAATNRRITYRCLVLCSIPRSSTRQTGETLQPEERSVLTWCLTAEVRMKLLGWTTSSTCSCSLCVCVCVCVCPWTLSSASNHMLFKWTPCVSCVRS